MNCITMWRLDRRFAGESENGPPIRALHAGTCDRSACRGRQANVDRRRYQRLVDAGFLTPYTINISDVLYELPGGDAKGCNVLYELTPAGPRGYRQPLKKPLRQNRRKLIQRHVDPAYGYRSPPLRVCRTLPTIEGT
jgi:hypothetical protein